MIRNGGSHLQIMLDISSGRTPFSDRISMTSLSTLIFQPRPSICPTAAGGNDLHVLGTPRSNNAFLPEGCSIRNDHDGMVGMYLHPLIGGFIKSPSSRLSILVVESMIRTCTAWSPAGTGKFSSTCIIAETE